MISNVTTFSGHMVVRVIKLIYSGLPVPFQLQEYLTAAPGPPRLQKGRSDSIALVFGALLPNLSLRTIHTMQCSPMQCSPMQCSPMQCSPMQCSPMQCSPMQCSPMQCSPMQCSPMQCNSCRKL